jgi:hypothetical protein
MLESCGLNLTIFIFTNISPLIKEIGKYSYMLKVTYNFSSFIF